MIFIIFLAGVGVIAFLLFRFRNPPVIYILTLALWVGALIYNKILLASCPGDCGIRVDLILVVPLLLLAAGFSVTALIRQARSN